MTLGSVFALLSLLTPAPTRLVVDASLLTRLQTLAATLQNEMVLCLTGTVTGAEAVVTGFTIPAPQRSTSDHATFAPCPTEAVAIWHNHPLEVNAGDTIARPRGDPNMTARDLCALSETDIRATSRGSHLFVVIAVDARTWCWWSRTARRRRAGANLVLLGDSPGGSTRIY